jgi:hypothetical protein
MSARVHWAAVSWAATYSAHAAAMSNAGGVAEGSDPHAIGAPASAASTQVPPRAAKKKPCVRS